MEAEKLETGIHYIEIRGRTYLDWNDVILALREAKEANMSLDEFIESFKSLKD